MSYRIQGDVIPFIKGVVQLCCLFAKAQTIHLSFETSIERLVVQYSPEEIAADLIQLICRVVTFTPQNQQVTVRTELVNTPDHFFAKIEIENSGVNLSAIADIILGLKNPCFIRAQFEDKTAYELQWHLKRSAGEEAPRSAFTAHPPEGVRRYYDEIRKRMSRAFNKKETLYETLLKKNPQDAVFLKKMDAIIAAHLDHEQFTSSDLAKSLAISRMQLYRKIKCIAQKAPSDYIRQARLEKARQLIEKTELTMGEICFQVGFQSQSHFTRAFVAHFGVRPTALKKGK